MRSNRGDQDNESDEKLRAYDGKDYSEDIEFPVELVDRDGVVRRYSYEESLAVYHRRIQSAPWRYGEDDLIRAEIGHCTRRIDQIKRSYRARAEAGTSDGSNPRSALGPGYDLLREHYAGLIRQRGLRLDGDLELEVGLLQDEPDCRVYNMGFGKRPGGHLLYIYPFDRRGDSDPQEAWRKAQDAYRGAPSGQGVEKLLLTAERGDAGYLLTGSREMPESLELLCTRPDAPPGGGVGDEIGQPWWLPGLSDDDDDDDRDSRFAEGRAAWREEDADGAADAFRRAVEANPFHREAYLALLAVLDGSGRYDEAGLYAEMALLNLPDDGLVRYRLGINMVRQGKLEEAVEVFDQAARQNPALHQPSYFGAHVLLARGRDLQGARTRLRRAQAAAPDDEMVAGAVRIVDQARVLRAVLRVAGLIGLLGAAASFPVGGLMPWALLAFSGLLVLGSGRAAVLVARARLQRPSAD